MTTLLIGLAIIAVTIVVVEVLSPPAPQKKHKFIGTCSVCGDPFVFEGEPIDGFDTWIDNDGNWGTWIRHCIDSPIFSVVTAEERWQ